MIADKIENSHLYRGLGKGIARGLELLQNPSLADRPDGRYEVDGDDLFLLVTRYATRPGSEIPFEAHRDYIDIQWIVAGQEIIGCAATGELEVLKPYQPDIVELADPPEFTEVKLSQGMFTIFYPTDAHKPCCDFDGQHQVHKLVVKVKV